MLRSRLFPAAALLGALLGAPAASAGAQTLPSSVTAQCVGGAIGCSQVDFFVRLLSPGTATLDFFSLSLTSPDWTFMDPNISDATDAGGDDPFVDPVVNSPSSLTADFLFGALVNDTDVLRIRFEFATYGSSLNSFGGRYGGGNGDDQSLIGGDVTIATSVVPEPASVLLLGSGLLGMAAVARHRRRRSVA